VRRAIQHSQASLSQLASQYGINPKTVAKWKKRQSVSDLPTGPKQLHSSVLSGEEEAIIVAFRRHSLLSHVLLHGLAKGERVFILSPKIRAGIHRLVGRQPALIV
jgi:transposase-like protein